MGKSVRDGWVETAGNHVSGFPQGYENIYEECVAHLESRAVWEGTKARITGLIVPV